MLLLQSDDIHATIMEFDVNRAWNYLASATDLFGWKLEQDQLGLKINRESTSLVIYLDEQNCKIPTDGRRLKCFIDRNGPVV